MGERRVRNGNLTASTGRTALFLDRDGVLNEPVWDERSGTMESPLKPSDVILAAGAAIAVRRATDAGLPVIVVSNQPSAAKGIVDEPTIRAVHARVVDLLAAEGAVIDRSYLCPAPPARRRREPYSGLRLPQTSAQDVASGGSRSRPRVVPLAG